MANHFRSAAASRRTRLIAALLACALMLPAPAATREDYFTPKHRLTAIGASRPELDSLSLAARTARMIEAETFTILREPQALEGIRRITAPRLQQLFRQASAQSGFPASTLAAIAYLES